MGIHGLTLIGRGHFSEVYSCKDLNGQPTGRVVKVSKTASSLDSIKGGQAGTEAYAMYLGEMCAQSGKRSPFVRVMLELILLAVPAQHDNQYVSVLFMEEGVRTVKVDVLRLAAGIHLLDGSFSAGRAAVRQGSRAAVLPCVRAAVRPGSRAAVLSCSVLPCGRAVVWPGSRAAVLSCGRAALLSCGRAAVRPCCRAAGQPCGRAVVRPGSRAAGRPCTQRLKLGIHCNKTKGCCGGGGGGGGGPAASGSGCPAAGVRGGGGGSAGRSRQRRARRDRLLRDRPRCRRRRTLLGEETSR